VGPDFTAERVTLQVLEQLEQKRNTIVDDEQKVVAAVKEALVPVRKAYEEAQLPIAYYEGLEQEIVTTLPGEWRQSALAFTGRERREFGLWRGGDPVARITYVFIGLVIGGLCVELPFIPIWEKWFPFLLAFSAWWLPNAQVAFHKRRYARALGQIALKMAKLQPALEGRVRMEDLLLSDKGEPRE
jgi:hypothetical protein